MAEPEIARRCPACGASVRQRAMFCPQCGTAIVSQPATETTTRPVSDTVNESAPVEALPAPEAGVRGRVEKLRKVSSVVLDQAAYDPSLRFLLVAAALFLLFLVLLMLSKVLG